MPAVTHPDIKTLIREIEEILDPGIGIRKFINPIYWHIGTLLIQDNLYTESSILRLGNASTRIINLARE